MIFTLLTLIAITVFGFIALVRTTSNSASLLPQSVLQEVSFTPYFYQSTIPQGYFFSESDVTYSKGVLSIRLAKTGSPDITISQQAMPQHLKSEDVLFGNQKLQVSFGVGTINQVEGRLLGSIVTNDPQPVLILINSQSAENQPIVTALAEALTKAR